MEEIFEKLEEWETVDEFREIAENILNRRLTTEELDGVENEDDDIVENLTREIFQTIEEDIPEDEREEFYDNHIDYLEYSKYDDEKLKRIGNLTGRNRVNARGIIASIKDVDSQIRLISFQRQKKIKKL